MNNNNRENETTKSVKHVFTSKILLASAMSWLSGQGTNVKFRGSVDETKVFVDVLLATKSFHNAVNQPEITLENLMSKLRTKQEKAFQFERKLGIPWPL